MTHDPKTSSIIDASAARYPARGRRPAFAKSLAIAALILAPLASVANANGIVLGKDANDNKIIVDHLYAGATQWRADGVVRGGGRAVRLRPDVGVTNAPVAEGGASFERTERGLFTGSRGVRGNPGYESGSAKR